MKDKDLLRIKQLDVQLHPYLAVAGAPAPRGGWLRAIREALGMSSAQLGARLKKKSQSIEDIQKSEANGTIQLKTLREVAGALECEVVYALVPRRASSLEGIRRAQAEQKAAETLRSVSHSMRLEDQAIKSEEERFQLQLIVQRLLAGNPRKLWE
jgi:predicted DNA-binding mobile mystery protein A